MTKLEWQRERHSLPWGRKAHAKNEGSCPVKASDLERPAKTTDYNRYGADSLGFRPVKLGAAAYASVVVGLTHARTTRLYLPRYTTFPRLLLCFG